MSSLSMITMLTCYYYNRLSKLKTGFYSKIASLSLECK